MQQPKIKIHQVMLNDQLLSIGDFVTITFLLSHTEYLCKIHNFFINNNNIHTHGYKIYKCEAMQEIPDYATHISTLLEQYLLPSTKECIISKNSVIFPLHAITKIEIVIFLPEYIASSQQNCLV